MSALPLRRVTRFSIYPKKLSIILKTVEPFRLYYSAALSATAQTDLVYTMPRILAPHAQQAFGPQISELPFESPLRKIFQVWHKTRTKEFGHQWLRAVVAKAANMAGIRADDLT